MSELMDFATVNAPAAHPADSAEALLRELVEIWDDWHRMVAGATAAVPPPDHPYSRSEAVIEKARALHPPSPAHLEWMADRIRHDPAPSPSLAASGTRKSAAEPPAEIAAETDDYKRGFVDGYGLGFHTAKGERAAAEGSEPLDVPWDAERMVIAIEKVVDGNPDPPTFYDLEAQLRAAYASQTSEETA